MNYGLTFYSSLLCLYLATKTLQDLCRSGKNGQPIIPVDDFAGSALGIHINIKLKIYSRELVHFSLYMIVCVILPFVHPAILYVL